MSADVAGPDTTASETAEHQQRTLGSARTGTG